MNRDDLPDAPPSAEEIAEAEKLRDALGDEKREHPDAHFARAIASAHAPRAIGDDVHRALVERAIAGAAPRRSRRTRLAFVATGAASALAMAAAFALLLSNRGLAPEPAQPEAVARARSTQSLFDEPFGRSGGESARIDRIAVARSGDLRDNRFAAWGVR